MSKDTEFEMYEVTVTQEDVSAIEAEEVRTDMKEEFEHPATTNKGKKKV